MNDLRNRGVRDILIACCDGLAGFEDAITAAYRREHRWRDRPVVNGVTKIGTAFTLWEQKQCSGGARTGMPFCWTQTDEQQFNVGTVCTGGARTGMPHCYPASDFLTPDQGANVFLTIRLTSAPQASDPSSAPQQMWATRGGSLRRGRLGLLVRILLGSVRRLRCVSRR